MCVENLLRNTWINFEVSSESDLSCKTCPLDLVLRRKWCFEAISRAFAEFRPDTVMHLAAISHAANCLKAFDDGQR
jgi:nucleoside-diphosphate-sugar epimerase